MGAVLLTQWARLLLDSLVQAGVRDAVISPGSRNTPFTWAALQHADLTCHSVIDERCAGFFALGQAKQCGQPSLLIATSGSAPSHYFPAIIEAFYSRTPLLILSADRPGELLYRTAPQTIDQPGMFGALVRGAINLTAPQGGDSALLALQASAAQAVQLSRQPEPGPVHINAPAQKPLEPTPATTESEQQLQRRVTELIARGPTRFSVPSVTACASGIDSLVQDIFKAERGLIACGALPPWHGASDTITRLARLTGFPLLAEVPSQLIFGTPSEHVVTGFDSFLRTRHFQALTPDLIIELGHPLTSQAWSSYRAGLQNTPRHVVAAHGWPDVDASASWMHRSPVDNFCERLCQALEREKTKLELRSAARVQWFETFKFARDRTVEAFNQVLSELPFGEAHAVGQVCALLPPGSEFVLGNSLPLRGADAFAGARLAGIRTLVQRGANGIDGLVSKAAGVAARSNVATTLLLGDVSLAHDAGGLALARLAKHPLVIVVIDNAGGRIFDELPLGSLAKADPERSFWLTPPAVHFKSLARAYGIAHVGVSDRLELMQALRGAYQERGATLISIKVPPQSYHEAVIKLRARCVELLDR